MTAMATLRGELVEFRVRGGDFWGTGTLRPRHDGGEVTIVGKLLGARAGDTLELEGDWTVHARFGRQFKLTRCDVVLPSDASGVVGWLAAKLPQISRRRAEVLVERHGVDGVWSILDAGDAVPLCELDGITMERAAEILAAYRAHRVERDRIVRLKGWGLTDNQIARIIATWGDDAETRMLDNPYDLIECVPGIGWTRADEIAKRMGVAHDAPPRIAAGTLHALREATGKGHVFVAQGKLTAVVATKVCGVDEDLVRRELAGLLDRAALARHEQNIYLPRLYRAEGTLADVFARRAAGWE